MSLGEQGLRLSFRAKQSGGLFCSHEGTVVRFVDTKEVPSGIAIRQFEFTSKQHRRVRIAWWQSVRKPSGAAFAANREVFG
jgi:hypothetical protein